LFIFLMHQINHSKANFTLISYQKKKEIWFFLYLEKTPISHWNWHKKKSY
jgi:hypothetical protein